MPVTDVQDCIIWGNHSSTQFPDLTYAKFGKDGCKAKDAVKDDNWVKNDFVKVSYSIISPLPCETGGGL